jgi:hypothetical protein
VGQMTEVIDAGKRELDALRPVLADNDAQV